jgi:hypothetical protein
MAAAAGLLMAVTLWSVSRLGDGPASRVAMSTSPARATEPVAGPPAAPSAADSPSEATAPRSRLEDGKALDRVATQAPATAGRIAPTQEQDERKLDSRSDALAARQQAAFAAAEEKQAAQAVAAPAGDARNIQLQTNTVAAGARPRGPIASQQANQQAGTPQQYAQTAPAPAPANSPPPPATTVAKAAAPVPAPAAAPAAPPAPADAAAVTRERRANEPSAPQVAETVTITSSGVGARRASARPEPERSQAAGAEREGQALSKDEARRAAAFSSVMLALPSFAEPGGRLRWRIADGRRLESSSDGGTTWTGQYTARDERLRAGTAPAIDSAWAVGERGLVLRFAVPGGWTAVSRPAAATLIAVSATGAQSARVTADDGRVFETADGGATWSPAAPGTGPR